MLHLQFTPNLFAFSEQIASGRDLFSVHEYSLNDSPCGVPDRPPAMLFELDEVVSSPFRILELAVVPVPVVVQKPSLSVGQVVLPPALVQVQALDYACPTTMTNFLVFPLHFSFIGLKFFSKGVFNDLHVLPLNFRIIFVGRLNAIVVAAESLALSYSLASFVADLLVVVSCQDALLKVLLQYFVVILDDLVALGLLFNVL